MVNDDHEGNYTFLKDANLFIELEKACRQAGGPA